MASENTQSTLINVENTQKVTFPLKRKKGVLRFSVHLYSKWLFVGFYTFQWQILSADVSSTGLGTE